MFKVSSIRVIAASVVASALVGSAIADMVYDDENSMSAAPTKVEVRNIINSAEPVSTPPVIVETQKIQKQSEKSREKRGFQESVNNELVVQKLEDRRLKQEEKLTADINKRFTIENDAPAGTPAPVMKEESSVKPIIEAPSVSNSTSTQMSAAPKAEVVAARPILQDQVISYQSSTSMSAAPILGKPEGEKAFRNGVSIIPKAGLSTISSSSYNISPKFMTGVGIGLDVSDNVGVEFGYAYSENGVRIASPYYSSPFAVYQPYNELDFKSNTFDLGLKLYLSGQDAKVRPYIGGGGAYMTGTINYDRPQYYYTASTDYALKQFQAMAQVGIDLKIASNISLGMGYKFYKPLTTSESEDGLYNGYFYNSYNPAADPNYQKQTFRGTIRDSNMSTFQVSANITF